MYTFKHRVITPEEIISPNLRGLLNFEGFHKYRDLPYEANGYFKLKELLAVLRDTFGEPNAIKLLAMDAQRVIQVSTELCLVHLQSQDDPSPMDLQLSILVSFIPSQVKGAGNNLKLYRKRLRECLDTLELDETFYKRVEELIIDNILKPRFLWVYRW